MKVKKILLILIVVAIINGGCMNEQDNVRNLKPREEGYFSLKIGGQVFGYNTYKVISQNKIENKNIFVILSRTYLKINMPGGEKIMDYTSETHLYNDYTPKYYKLKFSDGTNTNDFELKPDNLKISKQDYLCDGNVFDHAVYLFRALHLKRGEKKEINLLIPQLNNEKSIPALVVASEKEEEIQSGNKKYRAFGVKLTIEGYPEQTFWVTDAGELVKLSIPSQDFVLERSDATIITKVKGINMTDLLKDLFIDSNVSFSFMMNVTYMKAGLEVKITGEKVNEDFLTSNTQSFSGTVKDNLVKGIFENRVTRFSGENAISIPVEVETGLSDFLEPELKIESDDPEIIKKSNEIIGTTKNGWEATKAICDWVYKNIQYEITATGAKQALADLKGDCGPHALLAIALARASGIPSRIVGGLMYSNDKFGQHYWIETYMGEAGWIPSDPTIGEYGWIDATHIRLFQYGGIESLNTINVIDYNDEGRNIMDTGKRKLILRESYNRHYLFKIGENVFGTNKCKVDTIETVSGNTVYTFSSTLNLDYAALGAPKQLDLEATFKVDDDSNPMSYNVSAQVGEQKQLIDCSFKNNKAYDTVVVGDKTHEKEVSLDPGTILLENNMVCWFDLMYRSLLLKTGETYNISAFFPGNFLKLTITIKVKELMEEIIVNGKNYRVFVCDVPMLKEIDYVTEEGMLVKLEVPAQKLVVELE